MQVLRGITGERIFFILKDQKVAEMLGAERREVVNEAADLITSPEFREDPVDPETSNA